MKRMTFYGRAIDYSDLSHQHLSNIMWFNEILLSRWCNSEDPYAIYELNNRFGGIRLPYKPMHSFVAEVDSLLRRGYITNTTESDVIVDGKWVGKLSYT